MWLIKEGIPNYYFGLRDYLKQGTATLGQMTSEVSSGRKLKYFSQCS